MRARVLAAMGCIALVGGATAADAGGPRDRATGGGQVLVSTDGTGAGSTIAFTAQAVEGGARGQVQIVDRAAGTGRDQVKFHGVVDCLSVQGNTAKIGGTRRGGGDRFTVYVVDNGEGAAASSDVVFFDYSTADPTCSFEDDDDDDLEALARGNAQVHDAP